MKCGLLDLLFHLPFSPCFLTKTKRKTDGLLGMGTGEHHWPRREREGKREKHQQGVRGNDRD